MKTILKLEEPDQSRRREYFRVAQSSSTVRYDYFAAILF